MEERYNLETQEAAFASAGSEHRLEILETLKAAATSGESPLPFSKLRERVAIDDPGRLGYHLRQLDGRFLERTEEGYMLNSPGRNVVQITASGAFVDPESRVIEAPGTCPNCADALEASYEDGWLTIRCIGCESPLTVWTFPPRAAAERHGDELAQAFDCWVRHRISQVVDGVCPDCGGQVNFRGTTTSFSDVWLFDRLPLYECQGCYAQFCPTFGMTVIDVNEVRSFYRERDRDIQSNAFWTFEPCVTDAQTTIQVDPLRVVIRFVAEEDVLIVRLDDGLNVTSIEVA